MNGYLSNTRNRGFTLLELVVAIAVSTALMAVLYGALYQAIRSWQGITESGQEQHQRFIVTQHMRSQLKRILNIQKDQNNSDNLVFLGNEEQLSFVTSLSPLQGNAGLYLYQISTESDDKQPKIHLKISPYYENTGHHPELKPLEQLTLNSSYPIFISYSDSGIAGSVTDWKPTWPHKNRLPQLIKIATQENAAPNWPPLIIAIRGYRHAL